jgi:hypothetical protein
MSTSPRAAFTALVRALDGRGRAIADWSARLRDVERIVVTGAGAGTPGVRTVRTTELAARLHVDGPTGRGSAELLIDAPDPPDSIDARIDEALQRAGVSIGPGWRSSPPGAPAKVTVGEARLREPQAIARGLIETIAGAARQRDAELVDSAATVERAVVAIENKRGLTARWQETLLGFDARVAAAGATARARQWARRRTGLLPGSAIEAAAARAKARAAASETPAGRRPILLRAAVLGGDGAAILGALAALADATLHRQGLARARLGAAIVEGAPAAAEPLSLSSDGTLAWGLESAPLAEYGEPVRRFPIVDDGVLVGLSLDEREAALRGVPPNGGVRNLTVGVGRSGAAALRGDGVLEIEELAHVDLEPLTGRVALGIGLATLHEGGATRAVIGREVQGDLIAAFAASRRTAGLVRVGAYRGPDLVLLPELDVV